MLEYDNGWSIVGEVPYTQIDAFHHRHRSTQTLVAMQSPVGEATVWGHSQQVDAEFEDLNYVGGCTSVRSSGTKAQPSTKQPRPLS